MNPYLNLRSVRRVLITLLLIILLVAIIFGVRTKSHLDSFVDNLKSSASITVTSKSAATLSKDVDQLLKVTNLPLIKQIF